MRAVSKRRRLLPIAYPLLLVSGCFGVNPALEGDFDNWSSAWKGLKAAL
jgi:hypothetical protein